MAGNPIASLFAQLGFRYDDAKLKKFKSDLTTTAAQIDSKSGKSVGGATERARKKQSKFARDIKATYTSKVKPTYDQMKRDIKAIDVALANQQISNADHKKYSARIANEIHKKETQMANERQRQLKRTAAEQAKLDRQRQAANKKRIANLWRIEKAYDKHGAQLKQVRADYAFVNKEFKKGNLSIQQRERQLNQLIAKYRQLQAAQAGTSRARVGSAGGAFAGGADPRQAGNHRLISAIHSDVGLGAIAGGFAIAQSSRVYQEFIGLQQGLNAAMGDVQQGGKELEWLVKTSNRLGISLGAASEGYKTFAAATQGTDLAGDQTREIFEAVSSYSKVLNLSADDQKGVFRA